MSDFAKEGLANFLSVFSTYRLKALAYMGETKRRLYISALILFSLVTYIGTELIIYHMEQVSKNPKHEMFYNGLDIAELRSAADYLKVCETELLAKGSNTEYYCQYAIEQYVFVTATHGKKGEARLKSGQNPHQYISEFDNELLAKKAFPFMQAKLIAQVRRSENAIKYNEKKSFISKFVEDIRYANYLAYILIFICCIFTTGFMLHARNAARLSQS
jgi:hypothetical protein